MSTKKTIQINPELFKLSGNKTRRNKEKKELTINPVVTPNNLKNKLLKRIKEHKTQEINNSELSTKQNLDENKQNYSDEFYGALDYLSDLTKKNNLVNKKRDINNKTLKNKHYTNTEVSLDLPIELQENTNIIPQENNVLNINYKIVDDVPYGCLKNGKKQTYREWKDINQPNTLNIIRPPTPPKKNNETSYKSDLIVNSTSVSKPNNNELSREERLEQIKQKLKKIQDKDTQIKQQSIEDFKKLEQKYLSPSIEDLPELNTSELSKTDMCEKSDITELIINKHEETNNIPKKYLKKTIKRKFTLGKSDKLRRVSVLINNKKTIKNIIDMQKELKKTNITDVKKYLRQHGMIKVGSSCPVDILRKTFESAILTGEVTNTNKEIMLHNLLSRE